MSEDLVVIEKEARQFGWVPKEEFRGGEESWVDAETFVKRGKEINPILRANNERLKKELAESQSKFQTELAEVRQAAEEFKKLQKEAYEQKQSRLQKELSDLKQQRKDALREGDADLVVELEDKIDEVKAEQEKKPEPVKEAEPQSNQEVKLDENLSAWLEGNKWFGQNEEATEIANALGVAIRRQSPNLTGKAFLDKLDEKLKTRLPELYENPNQGRNLVDSSSTRGGTSRKTSYDNLPSEARAACDKYVATGLKLNSKADKKELIAEYIELYEG